MPRRVLALLLLAPLTLAGSLTGLAVSSTPAAAATTIDGPDVSSYQHPNGASINWAAVARSGREFAIVKATEGTSYVNHYFTADYSGIRKAGMVRGSYHFARPARPLASSALAQARFYVRHIGSTRTTKTLPPALDLEVTGGLSRVELITWAQDFLLDVRSLTGRTPMLYTYPWFWSRVMGDPAAFSRYPLWMAGYSGGVDAGATLWQYTAGATVRGIKGRVDMSRLLADTTTWSRLSNGTVSSSWPTARPGAPAVVHVQAGVGSVTVTWLPPDAGSRPLLGYTVSVARADGSEPRRLVGLSVTRLRASVTNLTGAVPYVVTVHARNSVGSGASVTRTVFPTVPTSLTVAGPNVVAYGGVGQLTATLLRTATGQPLVGARVTVSVRPRGSTTWTTAANVVTDSSGSVTQTVTATGSADYRFSFAGGSGYTADVVQRAFLVRQLVTAALSSPTSTVGAPVTLTGTVLPARGGAVVALQSLVDGQWQAVSSAATDVTGTVTFPVAPTTPGTTTYRLVVAATPALLANASAPVVLTVN